MSTATVSALTEGAVITAINAAGTGGTVKFPSGEYVIDDLRVSHDNQTWLLDRGAIIKRSNTTIAPIVTVQADGWRLRGGQLDGNRYVNPHVAPGIRATGFSVDMQDFDLVGVKHWGITISDAELVLRDFSIRKIGQAGVFWRITPGGVARAGPQIENGVVSRSDLSDYIDSGCIIILGQPNKRAVAPRVMNVRMSCANPIHRKPNNSGGLGIFSADYAIVTGNEISGGRMAISISDADFASISGNALRGSSSYHMEIVNSNYTAFTGNTIRGPGAATGVENNRSSHTRIVGNAIAGCSKPVRIAPGSVGCTVLGN